MAKIPFFFLAMLFIPSVSIADINKCLLDGRIVYTDQACPDKQALPFTPVDLNTATATEVTYTGNLWLKDRNGYQIASDASAKTNTPVLVYVYTDWCGYCKRLEQNYFADKAVQGTLAKFIKVRLNPEHSSADQQLFKTWGGSGYPTLYVQYPGQTPGRIPQPAARSSATGKEAFILMLEKHLTPFAHKQ